MPFYKMWFCMVFEWRLSLPFGCGHIFPVCFAALAVWMRGLLCCLQKVVLLRRMQRRPDLPFEPLYEDTAPAC